MHHKEQIIINLFGLLRRLLFFIICITFMLICTACGTARPQKFQAEFDGLFDTHAEIVGYAVNKAEFIRHAQEIYDELMVYSKLFDIYNNYENMNNLKTVNDNAGIAPVAVDEKIIAFLKFCADAYYNTDHTVNIAMGSVLSIWHDFREAGTADPAGASLPGMGELQAAALNMDIDNLIIDGANKTVYLRNKGMSLDVGAIAKGYAAGIAAADAKAAGMASALLDIGGNVVAVGKPLDGERDRWGVGIQDPRADAGGSTGIIDTVFVNDCAVVTSGDYQRFYTVGNVRYNHIIDPQTLMPARKYASVTVIAADSGLADELSTALFIMDEPQGREVCMRNNAEAIWVYPDGAVSYTDGYKAISKTYGGYSAVDTG